MGDLFRFNAQVSVMNCGDKFKFFLDLGDGPIESYSIPLNQLAAFARWSRARVGPMSQERAFSRRLHEACDPGKHPGHALELSRRLHVSEMCIYRWRHAVTLPSEEQVSVIVDYFGWDHHEALLDLADEVATRAYKTYCVIASKKKERCHVQTV